jgi:nucleoside-diphosphate-sugar epimerase
MKVLVTGGGGFLGRAIVERLLGRGDTVRFIARNRYRDIEKLGAEGIQGDIRNLDDVMKAAMGCEACFHTAALPGIWGDLKLYTDINVYGTHHVLEACRRRGVSKLVYTSSPSVVFDMKDENGVDEKAPYPQVFFNPYSETKACAEQAVIAASGKDGLLTTSLRPHLLWGPKDNHLIPRLIARARKRKLKIVGKGLNKVDLTYIDNAAMAHLLACDAMQKNRVSGNIYFISDDNPVMLWDWINTLLKQLELRPVKKRVPVKMAYAIGWTFEKIYRTLKKNDEPPMTRFLAMALSCSHYYNIGRAKRDFRYQPIVSNDEGVKRTVEWLKTVTPAT